MTPRSFFFAALAGAGSLMLVIACRPSRPAADAEPVVLAPAPGGPKMPPTQPGQVPPPPQAEGVQATAITTIPDRVTPTPTPSKMGGSL